MAARPPGFASPVKGLRALTFGLTLLMAGQEGAFATIPSSFRPWVVTAPAHPSERVFDLGPAMAEARRLNKPALVYFGAADCPPCNAYTQFLTENASAMAPLFASVVLVDIRTLLRDSRAPIFQFNGLRHTPLEFQTRIGDVPRGLHYPSFWLLSPQGIMLKQLDPGLPEALLTVAGHAQLLARP